MSKVYGVIYMIKNKVNRKVYIGQTRQKEDLNLGMILREKG